MTCVVCDREEVKATDNPLAPDFGWISKLPCGPCGGRHPVCRGCYMRWRLGPWIEAFDQVTVGPTRAGGTLEMCPESDEFRSAVALMRDE